MLRPTFILETRTTYIVVENFQVSFVFFQTHIPKGENCSAEKLVIIGCTNSRRFVIFSMSLNVSHIEEHPENSSDDSRSDFLSTSLMSYDVCWKLIDYRYLMYFLINSGKFLIGDETLKSVSGKPRFLFKSNFHHQTITSSLIVFLILDLHSLSGE